MGDVAQGVCVYFRVGSVLDQMGVTGEFALCKESPAKPPDCGIKPVKQAGEMGQRSHPKIAALDVTEFVKKGHAKGFRRPLGGVFGQVNGGSENPRNHGRIQPWMELKRDFLPDLELLQSFVEKSEVRGR